MDTGLQLGRRFRALKLWAVLRYFGATGIRARLQEHLRLAQRFASWVDESHEFERLAPISLWAALLVSLYSGGEYFVRHGSVLLRRGKKAA